jgi:heme-degrading monooxygenase HmoA
MGRSSVFADYHLRVGEIIADNAPPNGIVVEERRFDETETGVAKVCSITELSPMGPERPPLPDPRSDGLLDQELFESITNPGKLLILASWRDKAAAEKWRPAGSDDIRHRLVRVIRDYGMFDRREAPQFYPDAARTRGDVQQ